MELQSESYKLLHGEGGLLEHEEEIAVSPGLRVLLKTEEEDRKAYSAMFTVYVSPRLSVAEAIQQLGGVAKLHPVPESLVVGMALTARDYGDSGGVLAHGRRMLMFLKTQGSLVPILLSLEPLPPAWAMNKNRRVRLEVANGSDVIPKGAWIAVCGKDSIR